MGQGSERFDYNTLLWTLYLTRRSKDKEWLDDSRKNGLDPCTYKTAMSQSKSDSSDDSVEKHENDPNMTGPCWHPT